MIDLDLEAKADKISRYKSESMTSSMKRTYYYERILAPICSTQKNSACQLFHHKHVVRRHLTPTNSTAQDMSRYRARYFRNQQ